MATTTHAARVADPRDLLGRTFRIGDKCDALVVEVAFKLNGAVILDCVWWSGVDRKREYVHPQELGEEVVKAPFGFHGRNEGA